MESKLNALDVRVVEMSADLKYLRLNSDSIMRTLDNMQKRFLPTALALAPAKNVPGRVSSLFFVVPSISQSFYKYLVAL